MEGIRVSPLSQLKQNRKYCGIILIRGGYFSWIVGFLPICEAVISWMHQISVSEGKLFQNLFSSMM